MIPIMIIDEQTLFREGLQAILADSGEFRVVASVESGSQAFDYLIDSIEQPEVVLINLQLDNTDVIKTIGRLKRQYPKLRVLTLVPEIVEDLIVDSIIAGSNAVLMKQHFAERLLETIKNINVGDTVLSGPIAEVLANRIRQLSLRKKDVFLTKLIHNGYQLTNRELDIAYLLKKGYTNKEIASALLLREGTVKNYISEIYNKLNIRTRRHVIELLQDMMN